MTRPPPVSAFDIAEDLAADLFRAETLSRWIGVLVDAGETSLAVELDAELRAAIANGTEMERAA